MTEWLGGYVQAHRPPVVLLALRDNTIQKKETVQKYAHILSYTKTKNIDFAC